MRYLPASVLIDWLQLTAQSTERFAVYAVAVDCCNNVRASAVDCAVDYITYQFISPCLISAKALS